MTRYTLRPVTPADKPVITPLLVREWGSVQVVALSFGGPLDASELPGWLALGEGEGEGEGEGGQEGEVVGLLTYLVQGDVAELVTINAFTGGGVGAALVGALEEECRARGVRGIHVVTTNDNTRALRFYQRAGFRLTALRVGAVNETRKIKPEIPSHGIDGIPIRDEIELTKELQ